METEISIIETKILSILKQYVRFKKNEIITLLDSISILLDKRFNFDFRIKNESRMNIIYNYNHISILLFSNDYNKIINEISKLKFLFVFIFTKNKKLNSFIHEFDSNRKTTVHIINY